MKTGTAELLDGNTLRHFCSLCSFMWSFEKIHRSIAHIFQGELVASFDEEFRILFAQSEPLVPPANILAKAENTFAMAPFGNNMPFFPKKGPLMFQRDDSLFPSFMDRVDPDRYFLSNFRRDDMLRHTVEGSAMRMYKKVEMENSQMDPVRGFLRSKQLELDAFKRHSFAEGTFEKFCFCQAVHPADVHEQHGRVQNPIQSFPEGPVLPVPV